MADGIKRCFEIVDKEEDIIVDAITLAYTTLNKTNETGNSIDNWMRYHELKSYYSNMNNVFEVMRQYPKVNYRYLLIPTMELTEHA